MKKISGKIAIYKVDADSKEPLAGAVFSITNASGHTVATLTMDANGTAETDWLPYGTYVVTETAAPEHYVNSGEAVTINITEHGKTYRINVENESTKGGIKVSKTEPLPGAAFSLIDAETGMVVETAESDDNGEFVFTRFTYGKWIVRETETPEGYNIMPDMELTVDENWAEPEPFTLVNIPNHYEFIKADNRGNPLPGVKFALDDGGGNVLRELVSGEDGIVHVTDLTPGVYIIREIETLEGYTLSEETIQVVIDKHYVMPDEPFRFVNYPIIQTGAGLEMTALMWFGVTLVCIGCAAATVCILLDRRRPRR